MQENSAASASVSTGVFDRVLQARVEGYFNPQPIKFPRCRHRPVASAGEKLTVWSSLGYEKWRFCLIRSIFALVGIEKNPNLPGRRKNPPSVKLVSENANLNPKVFVLNAEKQETTGKKK